MKLAEGKDWEYKRELPDSMDQEQIEFLSDISSFVCSDRVKSTVGRKTSCGLKSFIIKH
jgi:hypothetical protein